MAVGSATEKRRRGTPVLRLMENLRLTKAPTLATGFDMAAEGDDDEVEVDDDVGRLVGLSASGRELLAEISAIAAVKWEYKVLRRFTLSSSNASKASAQSSLFGEKQRQRQRQRQRQWRCNAMQCKEKGLQSSIVSNPHARENLGKESIPG